jgi:myosin tail region-interacting protein MTI1
LPKPASFVRKPFIPPPPSKDAYFVPAKPSHSAKLTAQIQLAEKPDRAEDTEIDHAIPRDSTLEQEIGKQSLKERILAIQKGLDYSNKAPTHTIRRTDTYSETDDAAPKQLVEQEIKREEFVADEGQVSSPLPLHEEPAEVPESDDGAVKAKQEHVVDESDEASDLAPDEDIDEPESEVDPELARRIAIRERMAKMSGGMGMHMGIPPPPALSKNRLPPKPASSPPRSPSERWAPIPVIPGLPSSKSFKTEKEVANVLESSPSSTIKNLGDVARHTEGGEGESRRSTIEATRETLLSDDDPDVDSYDDDNGYTDKFTHVHQARPPSSLESSDEDEELSPSQNDTKEIVIGNSTPASVKRQSSYNIPGSPPPIPGSSPPPAEFSRATRPPPPPPPATSFSAPPVPLPAKFESLPETSSPREIPAQPPQSEEQEMDDTDCDDSSASDPQDAEHDSPRNPLSSPQRAWTLPPPPPPFLPPKSPLTFSAAMTSTPIPSAPRNFEPGPSIPEYLPPLPPAPPFLPPIEPMSVTPAPSIDRQFPTHLKREDSYSLPPEPSSPASLHRRTRPDRMSSESSQGRSSLDQNRRDGGYIALKEEDIHGGREWWRDPASPPPIFKNRPDLVYEVEDSSSTKRGGRTTSTREVYILFSDYSQTIVTVQFDRDDPSQATLKQRHLPPPASPSKAELESRYEQVGLQIVALTQSKLGVSVGDGTSMALIREIFSKLDNCLPSAGGRAHGALVYSNLGNSSTKQFDEIRPGDIVAFRNAVFQAHGGLRGKVTTEVGKPDHTAVVQEWNGSKKKLKVLEQGRESRKVGNNSYKIGDLKSGEVHVFRPMSRSWVDW